MKQYPIILAALALVAVGCAKEQETVEWEGTQGRLVTLTATAPETRVSISDGAYAWQAGDVIGVFLDDGSIVPFTADAAGSRADFTGMVPSGRTVGGYAVMPFDESLTYILSGGTLSVSLPSEYGWTGSTAWAESRLNMPMLGEISSDHIAFYAAGGTVKFTVKNIPVGSVKFVFEAQQDQIAGTLTADLSAHTVAVESSMPFGKSVTIDFTGKYALEKTFLVPLPVGEVNGFTLKFLDKDGQVLSSVRSNHKVTVAQSQIITAPTVTLAAFQGLVGHWTFENDSADAVVGNDGAIVGSNYSFGYVDGAADRYIHLGENTHLSLPHGLADGTGEFTIMAYLRIPERVETSEAYYNLFEQNDSRYVIFQFAINGLSNGLRFTFPGLADLNSNESRYQLDYGCWYRIYLVAKDGLFNIFIEDFPGTGTSSSDFSSATMSGYAADFNTMKSATGQNLNANAQLGRYNIHGDCTLVGKAIENDARNAKQVIDIAEMAVWNKALTVSEMYDFEGISRVSCTVYDSSNPSQHNGLNVNNYVGAPWYTAATADAPGWWIVDLGTPKNIEKITWYVARWGAAQPLHTKIYVSNDPTNDSSWVEISDYTRSNGNYLYGSLYSFNFPSLSTEYRYIKGYYDSMFGSYATCMQLHVYEKL